MKIRLVIFILFVMSCNDTQKQVAKTSASDTTSLASRTRTDNSKYYATADPVVIATEIGDTMKYGKNDFNKIVEDHPEFFYEVPVKPDRVYYCYGKGLFGSEQGQDKYYVLYAYFLKQRNGIDEYAGQRKRLIDIYSNINKLFRSFEYEEPTSVTRRTEFWGMLNTPFGCFQKKEGRPPKRMT